MKKILLLTLLSIPMLVEAQFKFDLGFTTMGSLKRKVNVGTIYQSGSSIDTTFKTRVYQPGALCIYGKPSVYIHNMGEYSKGVISFPLNVGLSSASKQSSTYGPTKRTYVFEYDAAVLYGIAGGSCVPDFDGYSKFGYFATIGAGIVGLTSNPSFDNDDFTSSKSSSEIDYIKSDVEKNYFNTLTVGPILHVGIQSNFFSFYEDANEQGIALTLRPGFGKSFSYIQVSFYMVMN